MTRTIFCSFRGALRSIVEARVDSEELANGLFVFGCAREAAFEPSSQELSDMNMSQGEAELLRHHLPLVAALRAAEAENRITWRPDDKPMTLQKVNDLLVRHGYTAVETEESCWRYPMFERAIDQSGQDLKVNWR